MRSGRAWTGFWKKWLKTRMCRDGSNTVKVVVEGEEGEPTKSWQLKMVSSTERKQCQTYLPNWDNNYLF